MFSWSRIRNNENFLFAFLLKILHKYLTIWNFPHACKLLFLEPIVTVLGNVENWKTTLVFVPNYEEWTKKTFCDPNRISHKKKKD